MATKRKPASHKKRISSKSGRARAGGGRFGRFINALTVSAIISFTTASCALNPQFRDSNAIEPLLEQLSLGRFSLDSFGWPQQQSFPVAKSVDGHVQTVFAQCPQFFPGSQPPIVPAAKALRELCFSSFAILHSGQAKTPVFVAQRLNRQMLVQGKGIKRTDRFYADSRLPAADRAELADYRGSGYSRGHMAPAGDMHNADAMAQSFSLANMVPQDQRHNTGAWSKIEQDTRKYIMRAKGDVYVFTGPAYGAKPVTIGVGRVAVPSYLYKVVYDEATGRVWAYWQANSADARAGAPISYQEFVRRTGMRLLH